MYLYILLTKEQCFLFLIFSTIKRTLQLSDDEDENLKKSKIPDDLSTLE